MKLTADQLELLHEMRTGVGRPYLDDHLVLHKHGLIDILKGRFGRHTRITEAGLKHLDTTSSRGSRAASQVPAPVKKPGTLPPEATAGPAAAAAGTSLRGSVPRNRRVTEQAGVAITHLARQQPPASPLQSGGNPSMRSDADKRQATSAPHASSRHPASSTPLLPSGRRWVSPSSKAKA